MHSKNPKITDKTFETNLDGGGRRSEEFHKAYFSFEMSTSKVHLAFDYDIPFCKDYGCGLENLIQALL
jgi:hypothetical protein